MNIFVVETYDVVNIAIIDFIPMKGAFIILNKEQYEVEEIVYLPESHGVIVFVKKGHTFFAGLIDKIKWFNK